MEKILRPSDDGGYNFWCPACNCAKHLDKRWTLIGTIDKPTIRPSVEVNAILSDEYNKRKGLYIICDDIAKPHCHLYITDGKIEYLSDCGHAFAGQTIDMVPF